MLKDKVKIISYNVNGLSNPIKRNKILTKMKKEQVQIVYLQETHLDCKEHEKLKRMGYTTVSPLPIKLDEGEEWLSCYQANYSLKKYPR